MQKQGIVEKIMLNVLEIMFNDTMVYKTINILITCLHCDEKYVCLENNIGRKETKMLIVVKCGGWWDCQQF